MKEHRSKKSYNSRLTRWIDRLLPFDFNIEHIPGAKMGLVDYISRQPNQKAKVTNKYDEEFAVATITRIRDAIAAIYVNTTPQTCQSQHLNSVTHTNSTRASHPRLKTILNCFLPLIVIQLSCFLKILQTQHNSNRSLLVVQSQFKSSLILIPHHTHHISIQFIITQ